MRKLIWCGTLMVLLVGASLFVAAQHAARHPDSFVGRCAMTIYHICDPLAATCSAPKPAGDVAQAAPQPVPHAVPVKPTPRAEVVEPIMVEPTEQEPPLAFPRLSPEIAAAIERLRSEEESEAPPQAFEDRGQVLRMPYADEEGEVLPAPNEEPVTGNLEIDADLPGTYGFFFLPPSCWQMVLEKVMDSIRQYGEAAQGSEETADEGTETDNSSELDDAQEIPYQHYHDQGCPYTGGCPSSYPYYRTMYPVNPAPAPTKSAKTPRAE